MENSTLRKQKVTINNNFVTKPKNKKNDKRINKSKNIKHYPAYSEISNDAIFLRNLRLLLDLNRTEASQVLGMSVSSLKRFETGINNLSTEKINYFLECYCVSQIEYMKFKAGKDISLSKIEIKPKKKVIENNHLRRSYKKKITNEVVAIKHLRTIKKLNQYELSKKCGWSRSSINHIEQGRIELTEDKLKHILKTLGFTLKKLRQYLDDSLNRQEIEAKCINKIAELETSKLKNIYSILENF